MIPIKFYESSKTLFLLCIVFLINYNINFILLFFQRLYKHTIIIKKPKKLLKHLV